jgi:hypothetical protein
MAIIITILLYFKQPLQLAIRTAAIIFIYLLATNFSFSINTTAPQNDPVVLIDYSQSMKNHLPHILDKISKTIFPHELFFFQESQIVKAKPDTLGKYTDITTALKKAAEMNPAASSRNEPGRIDIDNRRQSQLWHITSFRSRRTECANRGIWYRRR